MRRALLVAIACAALAGVVLRAPLAWGCSCAVASVSQHVKAADVVFVGTVATTQTSQGVEGIVRFVVSSVIKGSPTPSAEVRIPAGGDTCGIDMVVGR